SCELLYDCHDAIGVVLHGTPSVIPVCIVCGGDTVSEQILLPHRLLRAFSTKNLADPRINSVASQRILTKDIATFGEGPDDKDSDSNKYKRPRTDHNPSILFKMTSFHNLNATKIKNPSLRRLYIKNQDTPLTLWTTLEQACADGNEPKALEFTARISRIT